MFLDLIGGRPSVICGNDCSSKASYEFHTAYHRIGAGLDTDRQWERLLAAMPGSPGGCAARHFHTASYFDRIVTAARASNRVESALLWFRGLQRRYEEEARDPGAQPGRKYGGSLDVTAVRDLIRAAIKDLETAKPSS